MVNRTDIQTIADIESLNQVQRLILAAAIETADALGGGGGGGGATLTDIKNAIEAQGTVTLSTEGTQLQIDANLDEVEQILEGLQQQTGHHVNDTGQGVLFSPLSTQFIPGTPPGLDQITTTDTNFDFRHGAFKGGQVKVNGTTSNNGTYDIVDVSASAIFLEIGDIVAEGPSSGVSLRILGYRDPLSTNGQLAEILKAYAATGGATPANAITIGVDDAGNLMALTADATTKGLNTHIVSPPTWSDAVAGAYPTKPVDAAGTPIGTVANPTIVNQPPPTALLHNQGTATTSATAIGAGAVREVLLKNTSLLNDIYIGGAGLTLANGYPLGPGNSLTIETSDIGNVFVMVAAATEPFAFIGS